MRIFKSIYEYFVWKHTLKTTLNSKQFLSIYITLLNIYPLYNQKYTFSQAKMGSEMKITVSAVDTLGLEEDVLNAYRLTDTLIKVFSDYDPSSELSILNESDAGIPLKVSHDMCQILKSAQRAYHFSEGAFDITLGNLTKVWRKSRNEGKSISKDSIKWYRDHTGIHQYEINEEENILIKKNVHFRFDVGGIAKGYIAQKVSHFMKEHGWPHHLIDAGGDMVAGEAPPDGCGWKVALESPTYDLVADKIICFSNQAIATSGSTYQYYMDGIKFYSHIIQPKTGLGISKAQNVTVITSSGTDADWLATACSVMPLKRAKNLIQQFPNTTLIIQSYDGKKSKFQSFGKKITFTDNMNKVNITN